MSIRITFSAILVPFWGPLGALLGPIWEPGGRIGLILDPLKNQTPKKSKTSSIKGPYWGPFLEHLGVIFGAFLALIFGSSFWGPFGTHFGHFWARFGTKRALKINKKR